MTLQKVKNHQSGVIGYIHSGTYIIYMYDIMYITCMFWSSKHLMRQNVTLKNNFFSDLREREDRRETKMELLFHLVMHSLVDSCMCPDRGWNPRPAPHGCGVSGRCANQLRSGQGGGI